MSNVPRPSVAAADRCGPALDGAGLAAELAERFAARVAAAALRRQTRAEQREQFATARTAGLRKRNAKRLEQARRSQTDTEPAADPDPIPSDRPPAARTPQTTRTTRRGIS